MTLGQDCLFGIPSTAVQALVDGRHGDPFSILGPHQCGSMSVVRVLAPGAQKIEVVAREDSSWLGRLELAHPGGLFAGPVVGDRPYRLVIQWPEAVQETEDPYSFGLLLGELDLHLIAQGTHYELARCLGAQTLALGGVQGVRFAVWAPNARRVSVVGDFNTWDGRRHPMRLRREAGVWELFIPRIGAGALYKHELLGPDGALLPQNADPVARASEGAPGTASIVASSAPFAWTDQAWIAKRSERQSLDAPISIYEVHPGSWPASSESAARPHSTRRQVWRPISFEARRCVETACWTARLIAQAPGSAENIRRAALKPGGREEPGESSRPARRPYRAS